MITISFTRHVALSCLAVPPRISCISLCFSVVQMGNRCPGFARGSLRWWYLFPPSWHALVSVPPPSHPTPPYVPPLHICVYRKKVCETDLAVVVEGEELKGRTEVIEIHGLS
ncbi:hypothetical protein OG21DRAFT_590327 [Imleria badia]|nr:hypothetical protein OG21DRAFT_590327 [Imleria badia]